MFGSVDGLENKNNFACLFDVSLWWGGKTRCGLSWEAVQKLTFSIHFLVSLLLSTFVSYLKIRGSLFYEADHYSLFKEEKK